MQATSERIVMTKMPMRVYADYTTDGSTDFKTVKALPNFVSQIYFFFFCFLFLAITPDHVVRRCHHQPGTQAGH